MTIENQKQRSESEIIMDNIKSIFQGKIRQVILFDDEGVKKENLSEDVFKFWYLQPKDKDLYSAWESSFETSIEDYKNDDKEIGRAFKQRWIVELPKILFFLITRVDYDRDRQEFKKDNGIFEFDSIIYPDRYLIRNRDASDQLRNEVNSLRAKVAKLQEHINMFKNYNGKKNELGSILHSTVHLLKSHSDEMETDSNDDIVLYSPENLLKSVGNSPNPDNLLAIIELLQSLQTKTSEQVEEMEKQLATLQATIKDNYTPMNQTPYYLHSIMIHEGSHESGHYYTFIKDFSKGIYRKYNDISVTEVSEETVFEDAKGGKGTRNAYCLAYINEEAYLKASQQNVHNYGLQIERGPAMDYYNQIVPDTLADKVYEENKALINSIKDADISELWKNIFTLYDTRYKKITDYLEKYNPDRNYLSSVSQFFLVDGKTKAMPNEKIGKIFLLDIWYRELTNNQSGIQGLLDDDLLRRKLNEGLSSHKNAPKNLNYSDEEAELFMNKMAAFPGVLKVGLTYCEILGHVIEGEYKEALKVIAKQKELTPDFKGVSIARDVVKLLSLRYASSINQSIISGEAYPQKILPALQALGYIFREIIDDLEDNHYIQMIINLENTYEVAQHKMLGYKEGFADWIQLFKDKNLAQIELDGSWTPCFSEDLVSRSEKIENANYYLWDDSIYSESPNIAITYEQSFGLFKTAFASWIKVHRSIYKKNCQPFNGNAWLDMEEQEGIFLRQFANS